MNGLGDVENSYFAWDRIGFVSPNGCEQYLLIVDAPPPLLRRHLIE